MKSPVVIHSSDIAISPLAYEPAECAAPPSVDEVECAPTLRDPTAPPPSRRGSAAS